MGGLIVKSTGKIRRAHRTRSSLTNNKRPVRLVVMVSNKHAAAQLVDNATGKVLATSTSKGQRLDSKLSAKAQWVGTDIAKKAKTAKITEVAFDRGSRRYHGRIRALAEAAKAGGLTF